MDNGEFPRRIVIETIRYQCGHEDHLHATKTQAEKCIASRSKRLKAMEKAEMRLARNQRIEKAILDGKKYAHIARIEGISCDRVREIAIEFENAQRKIRVAIERTNSGLSAEAMNTLNLYFRDKTKETVRAYLTGKIEWPWTGSSEDLEGFKEIYHWAFTSPATPSPDH